MTSPFMYQDEGHVEAASDSGLLLPGHCLGKSSYKRAGIIGKIGSPFRDCLIGDGRQFGASIIYSSDWRFQRNAIQRRRILSHAATLPWECVVLAPGRYTISAAATGWQLRPYHHSHAPPAIDTHAAAPSGELGVWSLTSAPQGAYYIKNVGENANVGTLEFSGPQPYTTAGDAVPFAIQCAGNGRYVIKNPVADELWTAPPDAWVKILGANGDINQQFLFAAA